MYNDAAFARQQRAYERECERDWDREQEAHENEAESGDRSLDCEAIDR